MLLLLLLVGAAAAAYLVIDSRDNENGGGGGETPTTPIALVSATDFDPDGTGGENAELTGNLIDDNPATSWETEGYEAPAEEFGGAKDGVGFYVELDGIHNIDDVTVTTQESAWSADVYVADEPGTDLAGWGQPRGSVADAGTSADIPLDSGTRGRYVLLWLTRLPSSGKLHVNEIQIA